MLFEIRHGSFAYPNSRQVITDLSLSFDCHGVMSVLGANGAGKTTLLRAMLGLNTWTQGGTYIDDVNITAVPERTLWSRIGYVPQAKSLSFVYTIEEMVVLGRSARLGVFARPGKKDFEKVAEALETVGIPHLAKKACNEVSGGEYQLALVARALVAEPELLILDEPESNLDFKNQLRVLRVVERLSKDFGIGAIINTHFPAHALEISNSSLLLMPDGRHVFGKTEDVLTEKNLTESFGVGVKIIPMNLEDRPNYACVVAIEDEAP